MVLVLGGCRSFLLLVSTPQKDKSMFSITLGVIRETN